MSAFAPKAAVEGSPALTLPCGTSVYMADDESKWIHSLQMLEGAKCVAVDCEGVNLCRAGELCIMQVVDAANPKAVHLFDLVAVSKPKAPFDISTPTGHTLRKLCESDTVEKVFWDVRCDSDAVYHHHGVKLSNVIDLQVLNTLRMRRGRSLPAYLPGMAKTLTNFEHKFPNPHDVREHVKVKERAYALFAPEHGGSYEIWRARPLPAVLIEYCTDCSFFFALRYAIEDGLRYDKDVERLVVAARLRLAQDPSFVGRGRHMAVPESLLSSA